MFNTIRTLVRRVQTFNVSRCVVKNNWQISAVRHYAGKFSRDHFTVINEDELFDVIDDDKVKEKLARKEHRRRTRGKKREKKSQITNNEVEKPLEDKKIFTKIHDNEKYLSSIVMNAKIRNKRNKDKKMVLEGYRLMTDAIKAGILPEIVIYSNEPVRQKLPSLKNAITKFYKVPYKTLQLWSSVTTSSGLMGIYPMPTLKRDPPEYSIPLTIICDNIRDPGNMGSILRAAAAVGCEKLVLTKGCADIWDPKVLRSAAGAHFKLPIHTEVIWNNIIELIDPSAEIFAADNNSCNEELADHKALDEETECLIEELDQETLDSDEEALDSNELNDDIKNEEELKRKKINRMHIYEKLKLSIPSVPYHLMNYTDNDAVLIVGGETHGLSMDSLELLKSRSGTRVHIPLYNNMDSLNTGMAVGIVAYEINKQFTIKENKKSKESQKQV